MHRIFPLLLLSLLTVRAAEKKPSPLTVRIHAETQKTDGEFGTTIDLTNPPRKITIGKVPIISEKDFTAFYPFTAADGTYGAYFALDAHGSHKLESHSTEYRDTLVVALIDGRVACVMTVDKKITDGLLTIPSGFLPREIVMLQTKYPTIGKEKQFEEQQKNAMAALKEDRKKAAKAKAAPSPKPQS
jgi:hypothetical protein